MSTSTTAKSVFTKGKKAAMPAQLRATAREELNALFASAPGGSIAEEEEYADFARRVLAQLDINGGGEATEEVAYQAARLVHETVGFATGVEGKGVDVDVPWTHPLYCQAFAQVQAEAAAERAEREDAKRADRGGKEEAPASVAEVEVEAEVDELADDGMEVVAEAPPAPQTRAKRKVAPCPVRVPAHKPAAKVIVSRPKRSLVADEPAATPSPKKKARMETLVFPAPVWWPASGEPSPSIRCAYCTAHPGGGRCVLREGFTKCNRCLLGRQGCWAPGGGKKLFGDWYNGKGHSRAVRLDGVLAAKVIRSRGRSSDMPRWVKEAWEDYKSVHKALHAAGEGSLGESTASEGSRPPSTKGSASAKPVPVATPGWGSSAKLSHVEISLPRVRLAAPAGPSSSLQPAASSSSRAQPPPLSPSPAPAMPPTAHLPLPASPRVASPPSAPCPPSVPPFATEAALAPPSFRTPTPSAASAMPLPPPSTPQQLGLGGLVERETAWFRETFVRHLVANFLQPQDTTPLDPQRTPAGNAYVQALESVRNALSGQVTVLASTCNELRLRARNTLLSDAEIFGHPANR